MIRIFDVLVASVVAWVQREKFLASVSGAYPTAATDIVAGERQGLKGWLFLFEGVAGSFARLAMDSDVSDLLHPAAHLSIERFQRADLQTIEEVLLDVTD